MTNLKFTGGARIGSSNATWPLATLTVQNGRLDLNASIIGNLTFSSDDIISIRPYTGGMNSGIQIEHKVEKYNKNVIFWTFKNPNNIIKQIEESGFFTESQKVDSQDKQDIGIRQKQGKLPIKLSYGIALIVLWNICFIYDFINIKEYEIPLGSGALTALSILLGILLILTFSKGFQKLVLKEGREFGEISRFVYFLMFIAAIMLISLIIMPKP